MGIEKRQKQQANGRKKKITQRTSKGLIQTKTSGITGSFFILN
jgi:hypothetical protein